MKISFAYIIPNNGYNDTWQSLAVLVNSSNKDILVNEGRIQAREMVDRCEIILEQV